MLNNATPARWKMARFVLLTILLLAMLTAAMFMQQVFTDRGQMMEAQAAPNLTIGDYVYFGKYDGDPILWRIIHITDSGLPILFSDRILTIKPFDVFGSYHYYIYDNTRFYNGSNYYPNSNIRQWLNSNSANSGTDVIDWIQNDPDSGNTLNAYSTEMGFLANGNFSSTELNLIKPLTHKVMLANTDWIHKDGGSEYHTPNLDINHVIQNYDTTAYYKMVTDKVFLLSVKQLKEWVYDRSAQLGGDYRTAKPTKKATSKAYYDIPGTLSENSNWIYALNTPSASSTTRVRTVGFDAGFGGRHANDINFGIRPAMQFDPKFAKFQANGAGTFSNPYVVQGADIYTSGTTQSAPTATSVTATSLSLSWGALEGYLDATAYEVFQNGSLFATVNAPSRSLNVTGLQSATTYRYTFKAVSSGGSRSPASGELQVTTKSPPSALSLSTTTVSETHNTNVVIATLSATDVDSGDTFTYRLVDGFGGDDNFFFKMEANQLLNQYALDYESKPSYSIRLRVTDHYGLSIDRAFTITLTNVDDPPQAVSLAYATNEDVAVNGQLAGTDADSTSLTYSIVQPPTLGTITITNEADGSFRYVPNENTHGSDSFTFRVSDGSNSSNIATVSIIILPVNDLPTVNGQSIVINEDQLYYGVLPGNDADGDALTMSIVTQPTLGKLTITNPFTGAFSYEPQRNVFGFDSFTFRAFDGKANSIVNATVYIQIVSVEDHPVLTKVHPFSGAVPKQERWISYNDLLAAADEYDGDATAPLVFAVVETSAGAVSKNGNTPTSIPHLTIGPGEALIWTPSLEESGKTVVAFYLKVYDGTVGSAEAVPVTFTVTDVTAPNKPGPIVESDVEMNSVKLTWPAATDNVGIAKYELYLNAQLYATITPTTGATFDSSNIDYQVSGLTSDMVYTFFMRAFDTAGNASEFSNALYVVTLPPPDYEAPTAPSNLAATSWNGSAFTLTWSGATDNVMVTNYRVYRNGQLLPAQWPLPGVPNNPFPPLSYQVSNMPENAAVTFTVTAIDRAGNESLASAPFSVTYVPKDTTAPSVPGGLTSSNVTTSGFRVSWTASTDSNGVTGYNIYRNGAYVATVNGTITSYLFGGLSPDTTYNITILAYDAAKNRSALSTMLSVKTLSNVVVPDTQAPTVPNGLQSANVTTSGFVVSWNASADNIGIAGYNLYRNGSFVASLSASVRTYTFSGLAANTTYNVTVLAYDAAKNRSALSTTLSVKTLSNVVVPDTQAPTVPSGLQSANVTTSSFVVSWNAATDNFAVTGYNVYRNGTYVASLAPTVRSYTFSGLSANTTYSITVLAYDAAKNRSSQSTALHVNTLSNVTLPDTQSPTVPTNLNSANVTTSGFVVSWSSSTDNVGVSGYNVYRNGAYIATVSAATRNYTFSGLVSNTTYNITVLAFDAAKNRSALSSILSVRTL